MVRKQLIILTILLTGCMSNYDNNTGIKKMETATSTMNFFSKSVSDSFSIFISLPEDYTKDKKYPSIYILDANLYFDIYSAILKKYSEVGLLSSAILIGIGYKDFSIMDSLRNRDYTYPAAIPEYEMTTSGKADKFLSFIYNELVPNIDTNYNIDKDKRILMGHSLGGYFTLYALQQQLFSGKNLFQGFIAASPSIHYNHYYILREFEKVKQYNGNKISLYTTFGGLENDESNKDSTTLKIDEALLSLRNSLKSKGNIAFNGEVYSNLEHMDTPLPTFVKGLQWTFR